MVGLDGMTPREGCPEVSQTEESGMGTRKQGSIVVDVASCLSSCFDFSSVKGCNLEL